MEKILGIDLGTNSIGWAIREVDETLDNQIIDKGVLTFEKGVAEDKSGEHPKVQIRTESRGKRRNYQSEKYRKWNLLETLIKHKMCPLTIDELNSWRHYEKGVGRKYPQTEKFIQWLRFDFDGNGKPDFHLLGLDKHDNCYAFRAYIIDGSKKQTYQNNPEIIGRVLYQMVQRRGYNNMFNLINSDRDESKTIMEGGGEANASGVNELEPYIQEYNTLGAALYFMQKEKNIRIRKRYTLRSLFEAELKEICKIQNLEHLYESFWSAIIEQRPLRSQKGLVGFCTLDRPLKSASGKYYKAGKKRIPLSHPLYEEFRTWVDINNLKIEVPKGKDQSTFIQNEILPLFNKATDFYYSNKKDKKGKATKGLRDKIIEKGGVIHSKFDQELGEDEQGKKYKANVLLNKFEKIFGDNWKEVLKWDETINGQSKTGSYLRAEDIWHLIYDATITKQQSSDLGKKILPILQKHFPSIVFNESDFNGIRLQQGYASLSLSSIKTILPPLKKGLLYSHAVFVANLENVFGKKLNETELGNLNNEFAEILSYHKKAKEAHRIVNSLISDRLNERDRLNMGEVYKLDELDLNDIDNKIKDNFKSKNWNNKPLEQQTKIKETVKNLYQNFLRQTAQADKSKYFYKLDKIEEMIIKLLRDKYKLDEKRIKKYLWHPSQHEVYSPAFTKTDQTGEPFKASNGNPILFLGDPNPISRGFKNPMAIKSLQYLKKILNYLLLEQKIDSKTKIVVEIARELNDTNIRKAIKHYQSDRAKLRSKYNKEIKAYFDEHSESSKSISDEMIDRYELWEEQGKNCLYCSEVISCTDVMNGIAQIEHTIPAGISQCSELFNLTLAHPHCNQQKSNRIPTDWTENYELIKNNVKFMYKNYMDFKGKVESTYAKARQAANKESKDKQIELRHYYKQYLNYWRKKYNTFVIEEVTNSFRRQQLTDTQIMTKYAIPYLKTVFNKVEVQKGVITADFRKIYGIQPQQSNKNRAKHSHHAIDAAVLTLIPPSSIRDYLRKQYYEAKEEGTKFHIQPRNWEGFNIQHIKEIEHSILINFQTEFRTLTTARKKQRKRGKIEYFKDEKGNKAPRINTGDTIRGQLHDDTFFGAIKQPVYSKINGKLVPQTDGMGNFIFQTNDKRKDELFFVTRHREGLGYLKKIEDLNLVIDPNLRAYLTLEIESRIDKGDTFEQAILEPIWAFGKKIDKNGNPLQPIRHLRTRVKGGGGLVENPSIINQIKSYKSKQEYKNAKYATNGETLVCCFYEYKNEKEVYREIESYSILEIAKLKTKNLEESLPNKVIKKVKKQDIILPLVHIFKNKQKVLFYEYSIDELKDLNPKELSTRLYNVVKFEENNIRFKHHLLSMSEEDLTKSMVELKLPKTGASKFDFNLPIPKLRLSRDNFNFAIENKDFNINLDGSIKFTF